MNKWPLKVLTLCILTCLFFWVVGVFVGKESISRLSNLLPIFQNLIVALTAMSFGFFTYTDNVEQKVGDLYKTHNSKKVESALNSLASLRKEILVNFLGAAGVWLLEKLICETLPKGWIFIFPPYAESEVIQIVLRFCLFILAFSIFVDQSKALITAIEFRRVVAMGAKPETKGHP